jgi:hypothetical protein
MTTFGVVVHPVAPCVHSICATVYGPAAFGIVQMREKLVTPVSGEGLRTEYEIVMVAVRGAQ